jgi:signal transduction histidine kinase
MTNPIEGAVELVLSDKPSEYSERVKANEMNPVIGVFNALLNLGTENIEEKFKKYVRVTNFGAMVIFAGTLIYLSIAILWEKWLWLDTVVGMSLTCLLTLFLNGFGKTYLSRILLMIGGNTFIMLSGLFIGPGSHTENFFIVSFLIPFLLFDFSEMVLIAVGVGLPLIMLYLYGYMAPLFVSVNLPAAQQAGIYKINIFIQFVFALAAIYQYVMYNRRAEEEIEYSHLQMSIQTNELKRSNSDLEQFAYIISHDLKAPLRNISSFMNLLVNKHGASLNPEAREFVDYSRNGAKRMERLIDDVLSYCRIGTNLPNPTPVNLNDVVNTVRFELRDKLAAMNGSIVVAKDLPVIDNVHSTLMYHVFQNLITNGLKFNKSEKPEINIYWTNSLNHFTFSVHDNGIGISKEFSQTIFQMFKRLHTETEYDGTGIGLAICKKIVQYYNGEIWFESEAGKGTTFHFTVRKF